MVLPITEAESYVGEGGKSMKRAKLAPSRKNRRRDSPSAVSAAGWSYDSPLPRKAFSRCPFGRLEREVVNHPYALVGLKAQAISRSVDCCPTSAAGCAGS